VYNKFKESGQLDEYEESDGYVNVKFERDLSKWDGTFFQPIMSFSDRNKRFKEVGIVDEKDNLNKDFVFQNITTRTAGGFQYREQVIDEQSLRSNVAYNDLLKANAKGLMSQDIKQQKQFITGRLKWTSDTAKAYENATMEQREDFLIDQVLRKDLAAMGESREVTDEDIKNIPGLKKYIEKDGQKIPNRIYTKNIGKPTAVEVDEQEEEEEDTDFKMNAAERAVGDLLEDPISYLTNIGGPDASGVADRNYDEETKILEFSMTDKKTGSKKMKKFDLSDKSQVKNLARTLFNFRGNKSLEVSENIDSVVDKIFDFSETGDLPIF
jgi:hypothetical protein